MLNVTLKSVAATVIEHGVLQLSPLEATALAPEGADSS